MALITSDELQVTYVTFFARPADKSGYEYWVQQEKDAALTAISTSDEAKKMYAEKGEASAIDQVYQNLLGRNSDADGNYFWAKQLVRDADGNFTNLADIALQIATAARNNPNINPITGKLDSLAIEYKIDAAQKFTEALYENPTAAVNYQQNQQAGKNLLKGISADSTPATVYSAVNAAITTATQGGTSGEGTEFTFSNVANANLNDITNMGFTPVKTFLAEANDKIIVQSFDSLKLGDFKVTDPSGKDNDILTISLSAQNADKDGNAWFGNNTYDKDGKLITVNTSIKNIETIHIDATGAIEYLHNAATLEGVKTLEIAGDVSAATSLWVSYNFGVGKVDASGIISGDVMLFGDDTTELVGGAGDDLLQIGTTGGILTGNAGKDTFVVLFKNKLVTITDASKGDAVQFASDAISKDFGNKAKELTITGAADETTFIETLQKAADKEMAKGVYYAEFNGNTYVVANVETGNDKDDFIVKLTGSHDLATEATIDNVSLTFV